MPAPMLETIDQTKPACRDLLSADRIQLALAFFRCADLIWGQQVVARESGCSQLHRDLMRRYRNTLDTARIYAGALNDHERWTLYGAIDAECTHVRGDQMNG